jgi:hypothetical protein
MATIKIKRGTTDPTAAQVTNIGELAANTSTPKLFLKTATDSVTTPIWIGAPIEASPSDWTSSTKLATQSAINTTFMPKSGGTFTGVVNFGQAGTAPGEIRLLEDTDDGANYSAFRGSARAANITYVMPTTDPTSNQVLSAAAPSSNVSQLSWVDASSATTVTTTSDNTNTTRYIVLSTTAQSGATLYVDDTTGSLSYNPSTATMSIAGDLAVNGADITTTATGSASVFNTNATTLNIGGAATTVSIGAGSGTTTINNANTVVTGDLAVNGGDITTTSSGTATVFNTTATTLNMGGSATAVSIGSGASGTTTVNHNLTTSGDMNVASTKVYKVNGTEVLSATALGSGVVSSSLTSVGTIASGTWNGTTIAVANGGTGTTTGSITGSGALTFTAGGTNTNINLAPNGTGTVDVASKRITNVQTPSANNDAATKQYVDDVAQGLHIHSTAAAATTATLATLSGATVSYSSGTQAITWTGGTALTSTFTDGQAFTANTTESSASRVLVKNEGNVGGLGSQYNGIYYCYGARELRRASDGNAAADFVGGDFVFVLAGTLYNNTGWVQTEKINTLDTDAILWEQFSGAGAYTADEITLTRSGSQFSIKNTYTGQSSITTVGTLTAGTLGSGFTTVGTSVGGTGLTSFTTNGAVYATSSSALTTGTLPVASGGTGITSFGSGVATWLGTPSSANLASAVTDETGSGSLVFGTSPNFTTSVTTGSTTFSAFNATATTLNIGGAATTLTMGATSGTAAIRNATLNLGNTTAILGTNSGTTNSLSISPYGNLNLTPNTTAASLGGTIASLIISNAVDATGLVSIEGGDLYLGTKSADGISETAVNIIFEGTTDNGFETTLTVTDPTEDRTITLPNATGTVITTGNLTSITTTGTISSGTWNGTAIGAAYGGTGQTTYTTGDILYASGSSALSKLSSSSTAGAVLASTGSGAAPEYKTISLTNGSVTSGSGTLTLAIQNAAADGSTKGLAAFNSTSFSASSGVVDIATVDGGTY